MQTNANSGQNQDHTNPPIRHKRQSLFYALLTLFVILLIVGILSLREVSAGLSQNESPSPTQFYVTSFLSLLVLGSIVAQIIVTYLQWNEMREQQSVMRKMLQQTKDAERPLLVVREVGCNRSKDFKNRVRPFIHVRNMGRTAARRVCIFFEITDRPPALLVSPIQVAENAFPATLSLLAPDEKVEFTGSPASEITPTKDEGGVSVMNDDGEFEAVELPELTIYGFGFYESLSGEQYSLEPFAFDFRQSDGWSPALRRIVDSDYAAVTSEAARYIEKNKKKNPN